MRSAPGFSSVLCLVTCVWFWSALFGVFVENFRVVFAVCVCVKSTLHFLLLSCLTLTLSLSFSYSNVVCKSASFSLC